LCAATTFGNLHYPLIALEGQDFLHNYEWFC